MIFIPLMLLALSGGIFLLMQVESKGLGRLYKSLSWLVIFLCLLFLAGGVVRGVIHHRKMARMYRGHQEFFRGHGRGAFGPHCFGGPHIHDWKNAQTAVPDSTAK